MNNSDEFFSEHYGLFVERWFKLSSDAKIEIFINDSSRLQIRDVVRAFVGLNGEIVYVR